MELQEKLMTTPRENAGARSSNRFDFQKNWALGKLIELQESKNEDYAILMDYQEDVVVLDSSLKPSSGDFIQVKTNNTAKSFNVGNLCKKTKSGSKLGKLYYNYKVFKDYVGSLVFVSNIPLKVTNKFNKCVDANKICFLDICDTQQKEIIEKISSELELPEEEIKSELINYEMTDLGIHSHSDATIGKLSRYIEKYKPEVTFKPNVAYMTIFDEIRRKSNQEFVPTSFDELIKLKSISKKNFEEMVDTVIQPLTKDIWKDVSQNLVSEGFLLSEQKKISQKWNTYLIERLDKTNITLQQIKEKIIQLIKETGDSISTCKELIDIIYSQYIKNPISFDVYGEYYLKTMILMEFFEND